MQIKLNTVIVTPMIAALSASALPTYYTESSDLAARSTGEDFAYLEARYAPEAGSELQDLIRRDSIIQMMFGRFKDPLTAEQKAGFEQMRQECNTKLTHEKKKHHKCLKFVEHLERMLGEQHWGYTHWLGITGATEVPPSVILDMKSLVPAGSSSTHGGEKAATAPPAHNVASAAAGGASALPPPANPPAVSGH